MSEERLAGNGTLLERPRGLQPHRDSDSFAAQLLLQHLPEIVEFRYECLDARGKPITVPERCASVSPPKVTGGDEPEPECTCSTKASNSVGVPSLPEATEDSSTPK